MFDDDRQARRQEEEQRRKNMAQPPSLLENIIAPVVLIGLMTLAFFIVSFAIRALLRWADAHPRITHPCLFLTILFIGFAIYRFKKRSLECYGYVAISFGIFSAWKAAYLPDVQGLHGLANWLALAGAAYAIAKGVDDARTGRKNSREKAERAEAFVNRVFDTLQSAKPDAV